jgi:ubiquitin-conjugating enzyme E2 H
LPKWGKRGLHCDLHKRTEYCERYAKAEDIGRCPEEDSSDGEASEKEEYMSSDEEMAGHADL